MGGTIWALFIFSPSKQSSTNVSTCQSNLVNFSAETPFSGDSGLSRWQLKLCRTSPKEPYNPLLSARTSNTLWKHVLTCSSVLLVLPTRFLALLAERLGMCLSSLQENERLGRELCLTCSSKGIINCSHSIAFAHRLQPLQCHRFF